MSGLKEKRSRDITKQNKKKKKTNTLLFHSQQTDVLK